MKKYSYGFSISAPSEEEADRKAKALTKLGEKFSLKELEALVNIAENDPVKLAAARAYLNIKP